MMSRGKEDLCGLLASLFSPPDRELARQIGRGLVHSFLQKWVSSWEGPSHLLKGFCMDGEGDAILDNLKDGYERLFSYLKKENISLIESFYKSWTRDPHCALSFSTEKGLVMGNQRSISWRFIGSAPLICRMNLRVARTTLYWKWNFSPISTGGRQMLKSRRS